MGCLCAALFTFYEHLPGYWYGNKSATWVSVVGKIESVCVTSCSRSTCSLDIVYRFYVDGTKYTGNKIYAEQSNSFYPREATRIYESFQSLPEIPVYYDPFARNRACLRPGHVRKDYYLQLLIGIFLFIASIYLFFFEKIRQK
jgi:Protein of unknown function (DUF3592)